MNDPLHSLFLAQAMGLYLVIWAIILLAQANYYRQLLTHTKEGSPAMMVAATLGLMLGIILVLIHNIWIWESELVITLVAWILLIKSVMWLAAPKLMVSMSHKMYSGWVYYGVVIVAGIFGVILMAHGFFHFI